MGLAGFIKLLIYDKIIMKRYIIKILLISFFIGKSFSYYSEGDNLLLPRQNSMANTGYSLSEDENVLYYNPAGLGLPKYKNNHLSTLFSSIIRKKDDNSFGPVHKRGNIIYGRNNAGGFALDISMYDYKYDDIMAHNEKLTDLSKVDSDFINMINDLDGKWIGICDNNGVLFNPEYLISFGWGHNLSFIKLENHSIGLCFNLLSYNSDLNLTTFDFGYLYVAPFNLRAGISLKNLIQIQGKNLNDFDISKAPRIINTAIGYCNILPIHKDINFLNIAVELNGNLIFREERYSYIVIKSGQLIPYLGIYPESGVKLKSYGRINIGSEFTFLNSLSFRIGYTNGNQFVENEFYFGFGLSFLNHISVDFYKGNDQVLQEDFFQFTISLKDLLKWDKKDLKWWLKKG